MRYLNELIYIMGLVLYIILLNIATAILTYYYTILFLKIKDYLVKFNKIKNGSTLEKALFYTALSIVYMIPIMFLFYYFEKALPISPKFY